jgi:hypothetical protein
MGTIAPSVIAALSLVEVHVESNQIRGVGFATADVKFDAGPHAPRFWTQY